MTARSDLMKQLEQLDVPRDRPVAAHTSLRAVGETEGGGEGFLDALISWVTKDCSPDGGLLCIPTHTWNLLGGADPVTLDMNSDKTCVGTLPTLALRRIMDQSPDAPREGPFGVRSLHPTHSMAVFGNPDKVRDYTAGEVMTETSTNPKGCWGRLYDEGGSVLLIGVGHDRDTYLHSVEERLDVPNRLSDTFVRADIRLKSGDVIERPIRCHRTVGISEVSAKYPKYEPAFRAHGCIRDGVLGAAKTQLCDCRGMARVMALVRERSEGAELLADAEPLKTDYYLG